MLSLVWPYSRWENGGSRSWRITAIFSTTYFLYLTLLRALRYKYYLCSPLTDKIRRWRWNNLAKVMYRMSVTQPGPKSSHRKPIIFPVKHVGNGESALYKTIFTTFLIQICIWKCEFIWTSCQVAKDWQLDCFLESAFSFERYLHARASRESKNTPSFHILRGSIVSYTKHSDAATVCRLLTFSPFSVPATPAATPLPLLY